MLVLHNSGNGIGLPVDDPAVFFEVVEIITWRCGGAGVMFDADNILPV
jgi:hypothetical protein